jgi:Trk K+ transport system NAD-binding subunit
MYRELGVETVCPTTVGAKLIRDVLMEAPWDSQTFDFGKLTSLSVVVSASEAGKQIGEIEDPGRIRIGAVRRKTRDVVVASSELILEEGDELSAVVAPEAISEFAQRFRGAVPQPKVTA